MVNIIFWLLFVHPHPSSPLSERKQGRSGKRCRKSVPRSINQIVLSKNKVLIYAYADQLNISTSYWLTGWYASVLGGQIFDSYGVDSLVVLAQIYWHTHFIFWYPMTMLREDFPYPLIHWFWRFMVPSVLNHSKKNQWDKYVLNWNA